MNRFKRKVYIFPKNKCSDRAGKEKKKSVNEINLGRWKVWVFFLILKFREAPTFENNLEINAQY